MRSIVSILIGIVLRAAFMYLVDTAWINENKRLNQSRLNSLNSYYTEALDVSNAIVNNCYDAFYTISKCSTKEGCDFEFALFRLTDLNLERKSLKLQLDQPLGGTEAGW